VVDESPDNYDHSVSLICVFFVSFCDTTGLPSPLRWAFNANHETPLAARTVIANTRVDQLNFFHRHLVTCLQAATPHASPTQELNRAIGSDGTVYVGSGDKKLYAIKTESLGLAKSPWPMRGQNALHTGRVLKK